MKMTHNYQDVAGSNRDNHEVASPWRPQSTKGYLVISKRDN